MLPVDPASRWLAVRASRDTAARGRRRTPTGSPRRARCRPAPIHSVGGRGIGVAGPTGQLRRGRHPVVPWRRGWSRARRRGRAHDRPARGRWRRRAVRERSGVGSRTGSTMGPRPSPARAASIAASVTAQARTRSVGTNGGAHVGVVRGGRHGLVRIGLAAARRPPGRSSPPGRGPRARPTLTVVRHRRPATVGATKGVRAPAHQTDQRSHTRH